MKLNSDHHIIMFSPHSCEKDTGFRVALHVPQSDDWETQNSSKEKVS